MKKDYTYHDIIDADKNLQEAASEYESVFHLYKTYDDKFDKYHLALAKVKVRKRYRDLGEKVTEACIEDEAYASEEFQDYINKRNECLASWGQAKIKYEKAISHKESVTSAMSYKKKEMELQR